MAFIQDVKSRKHPELRVSMATCKSPACKKALALYQQFQNNTISDGYRQALHGIERHNRGEDLDKFVASPAGSLSIAVGGVVLGSAIIPYAFPAGPSAVSINTLANADMLMGWITAQRTRLALSNETITWLSQDASGVYRFIRNIEHVFRWLITRTEAADHAIAVELRALGPNPSILQVIRALFTNVENLPGISMPELKFMQEFVAKVFLSGEMWAQLTAVLYTLVGELCPSLVRCVALFCI